MLLVRFWAILRLELFSRVGTPSLICSCTREHYFLNFIARSHQILFIWPNYTARAISCNSKTPTFFARALSLFSFPFISGALFVEFSCAITPNIIYLAKWYYSYDFAQFWDSNIFRARALAVSIADVPESTPFLISHAITSNIIYIA